MKNRCSNVLKAHRQTIFHSYYTTDLMFVTIIHESKRAEPRAYTSYQILRVVIVCLFGFALVGMRIGKPYTSNVQELTTSSIATMDADNPNLPSAIPADGMPRAIISHACSGSSITMRVTEKILRAHGYNVFHGGQPILHKDKDIMDKAKQRLEARIDRRPTKNETLAEIFVYLNERAAKTQKILLFKIENYEGILETLKGLGTKFTYTYRSNYLSRAICAVRDCFQGRNLGSVVYANGTKADICFSRRHSDEKVMAHFNMPRRLINQMQSWENRDAFIKEHNSYHPAAYEDLFKFEYTDSEDVFDASVKSWCAFLETFGEIKEAIVREVLQMNRNSRPPPPPVEELIYNFDEIKGPINESLFREYLFK